MAAFVAASSFFVSCSEEEKDPELVDGTDFTLIYTGEDQNDGRNINATVGIMYSGNLLDVSAVFLAMPSSDCKFVSVTEGVFDQIKTKDALKRNFETAVNEYGTGQIVKIYYQTEFTPSYFMVKKGSDYFLVKMVSLTIAEGNCQAKFSYKF